MLLAFRMLKQVCAMEMFVIVPFYKKYICLAELVFL